MPAYNAEKYIAEAIQGVLDQTFSNFEFLIINDGSTDQTEEIILSFDDERIRYVKNEENLKLIAALNKGIDLARGKYIARIDADDICLPDRLKKQSDFLIKHTDCVLCGSWAYLIDSEGEKKGRVKFIDEPKLLKISLLFSCPIIHPSVMIRTEIIKEFKYSHTALHTEDFDLWLRITNKGFKIANIADFLIKYRWHDSNISVENEDFQIKKKAELLKPYIENFIGREVSAEELDLHLLSFCLYHLGKKKDISNLDLHAEKKWLESLACRNREIKKFSQIDFEAFLWSRWIVCCLATRKSFSIFSIHLTWYKPSVVFKTLKLLIYK
jgi:glycosyltransferase involved in cell wall biosynthesis